MAVPNDKMTRGKLTGSQNISLYSRYLEQLKKSETLFIYVTNRSSISTENGAVPWQPSASQDVNRNVRPIITCPLQTTTSSINITGRFVKLLCEDAPTSDEQRLLWGMKREKYDIL